MRLAAMVARFLGRPARKPRPRTRLTDDEVLAIASAGTTLTPVMVLDVERRGGGIVWTVGTRNRGANECVEIDDATGVIASHRFFGSR